MRTVRLVLISTGVVRFVPLVLSILPYYESRAGATDVGSEAAERVAIVLMLVSWGLLAGGSPRSATAQERPRPDTLDSASVDSVRIEGKAPTPLGAPSVNSGVGARLVSDTMTTPTTEAPPDTGIVSRYVPATPRRSGTLFPTRSPLLGPRSLGPSADAVTLDSTGNQYRIDGKTYTDGPMTVDAETYRRERYRANRYENWTALVEQRQQGSQRGGLGVSMTVPGGRESAFTTIFGKPQVDLRVNGKADINAGFEYSKNDQQGARTGDATQLDPNFKQDLRLGITGTIGDKLTINVDWDTNNQFDYKNQVKLKYSGYDDEIIQSIEAGNVFMETPSQLISGGQSLFGIKGQFQFGNLNLTTIASQQEGQSNSLSIEGGAEKTEFNLKPTDYDEDSHFFLGYYFRNNWNRAHQDPTSITLSNGFNRVTDIEVWKLQTSSGSSEESDVRRAAAVVDLGEPVEILRQADGYTNPNQLMGPPLDQYEQADLEALRGGNQSVSNYVESASNLTEPLQTQDWESGNFKKLERGRDYKLDGRLGFVSLKQRLRPNEALAVAFRYQANGQTVEVGDFTSGQGGSTGGVTGDRLVLKLLRPTNPVAPGPNAPDNAGTSWFLELKNIYRLAGRGFTSESFNLDIEYSPSGQGTSTTLSQISNDPLLQVLGLDRVNQSGAPSPDNEFDFTGQTINSEEGLIYFPFLQPFGERILDVADANGNRSAGQSFAFENLYVKKKTNAEKEDTGKNVYKLTGSYSGQAKGFYDLKAFTGLVNGSVEVTSGGQTLKEGQDYVVDYQSGTVNITNKTYLTDGREINISYEQQSVSSLQQKTLLGARADWSLRDRFALGATIMRLSEKSPVDKYRIGQEPIKNTIWGVDGSMNLEPRWLTGAVDALPLVETREKSTVSLTGEFAQLRPGHTRTEAFQQTLNDVESSSKDEYASDERNGVSYIDDFEGFENTFSLREQLQAWQVSAAPDSIGPMRDGSTSALKRTWWRGSFGWYQLNEQIKNDLSGKVAQPGNPEATELFDVQDVFDRDTRGSPDQTLRTLDMYFNPWKRGPYNYLDGGRNLIPFIQNPTQVWGGVTRKLPEGYTDFSVQNVEFVEFIVKPYPQNGQMTDGAKLYVNLGTVSEDVVPNQRLNTEDGLSLSFDEDDFDELSRIAGGAQDNSVDVRGGVTEDLGLDGLVSYTKSNSYDDGLQESAFYDNFVDRADSLQGAIGGLGLSTPQRERLQAELARIQEDPSADDYHHYENDRYFGDASFFPEEPTLQERFTRYYAGDELNTFEGQNELAEDVSLRRGISGGPDSEDLGGTGGSANITNNYFRYVVPLDSLEQKAERDLGPTDYVVSKVGRDRDWYKVRIPVRAFAGKVGSLQDFTRIESIRMWTTGHKAPVTMRFASLELVGSQWRQSPAVTQQPVENGAVMDQGEGELRVASINNEEDPNYEAPVGAIVSKSRTATGVEQRNREQALLLNVDKLEPGRQRGVFKTFQQGLDLLKYSNLRMYTHVHGASNSPQEKKRIRENLRLFVRLGANESGDYYEYEQPLTVSNVPGTEGASSLWPEEGEMNLVLSALSQLKTARDQSGTPTDTTFTSDRVDLPLDFAPDGTKLKIRGTPSLDGINTAVIGVRHVGEPSTDAPLEDVEVWVNELRVSGFDEESGWATNTSTNIKLADLATVQGSFQRRTDGFGSLSSTLSERRQSDNTSWNVRTDFNVDALLPEQQGWDIPISMQLQSSLTEPQFDPQRGDVRVSEVKEQFDILPDSTIQREFGDRYPNQSVGEIRGTLKDSVQRASETYNFRRTFTANMSKSGSESWWVRNTVDATSLNFSYFDRSARSPQNVVNDEWSWSSGFQYKLDFGQARTVQPLGFLPKAPVLSSLGGVEFNYVPTSLSFSGSAERSVSTTRSRPSGRRSRTQPLRIANPFRESQNFTHNRSFSLQYDPFGFLGLNFDTNTKQNLNEIASQTQNNLILSDSLGGRTLTDVDTSAVFQNPQRFGFPSGVTGDSLRSVLGEGLFVEERLQLKSEQELFRDLFFGSASPRTNSYRQRLSATLQIGVLDRKALNWISVQDVSYQSSFRWQNGARGSLTGASVQNSVTLRSGVSLHPNKVWERFGFYKRMKEAQRSDGEPDESPGESASPPAGAARDTTGQGTGGSANGDDGGTSWDDLPLPDPLGILRGFALTFMDIRDFTVNYNGERTAQSSNVGNLRTGPEGDPTGVGTDYSILDAIRGEGPPLGYRLGLSRSIDLEDRVFRQGQVVDNLQNRNRFEARTALSPSSSFNIDLNWNVSWTKRPQIDIQRRTTNGISSPNPSSSSTFRRTRTESGSASASVWAFGSYQSFFKKQLAKFRSSPTSVPDAEEVALTKSSVAADFREAYLTGSGSSIGGNGFAPFPMPSWTVRYSGLSDWPLIEAVTESVSLNHGYSGEYQTGFNSISTAGDTTAITVAGQSFRYEESRFEPQSVQVQEQFQPLIGVDVTWPFGLETSVEWNRRNTTALRGTNVVERKTSEISGRLSYSKRGMDIPFFARIENRLQVSVTLTRSVNDEREFLLNEALQQAEENPNSFDPSQATKGDNVNPLSETTLLKIVPEISYNVSNRVTARFLLEYEKFNGDNRRPSYTNVNGSFNLSVSISEN